MQEKTGGRIPMYVSYSTFTTFLDWLGEMPVTPTQIDRSLWTGKFSGGTGSQLMSGLRFLGLIDGERPTDHLEPIVRADSTQRKQLLAALLKDAYGANLVDGLRSMTPKMLNEQLERLGATDATLRKAFSFIVNAAKANDIPIAPTTAKKARNKPARKTLTAGRKPKAQQPVKQTAADGPTIHKQPPANTRVVDLKSGGQVFVSISIDLFDLSPTDRKFVMGLIDSLKAYNDAQSPPGEAAPGNNEEAPGLQDLAATPGASEGSLS